MKRLQTPEDQSLPIEEQLVGINAKTAPYPAARSWSGGRRRILGKGALESYTYHVMSRTCGGEKDARHSVLDSGENLSRICGHEEAANT